MGRWRKSGGGVAPLRRTPSGELSRAGERPRVSLVEALRVARIDDRYASAAGIACIQGEIGAGEFEIAKRIARIVDDYRRALLIAGVASSTGEGGRGGAPVDVDSEVGEAEAKRHAAAVGRYDRLVKTIAGYDRTDAGKAALALDREEQVRLNATIRFSTEQIVPGEQASIAIAVLRRVAEVERSPRKNLARGA